MNNKLFSTKITPGKTIPKTNTVNEAGGVAYQFTDKHALAQYLVTGTFGNAYYTSASEQLDKIIELSGKVDTEFLAKAAIYARQVGMKDTPALMLALLSGRDTKLFKKVFGKVVVNPKMLRNFVQVMRSGRVGRKSFGTAPKSMIKQWFNERTSLQLFNADIGNSPSLPDIIKLTHPKADSEEKNNLFKYILGKEHSFELLPEKVRQFELYKKGESKDVPDVPFQFLTALNLDTAAWTKIALNCSWNTLRMNLNTFQRHGVFNDSDVVKKLASKIADKDEVKKNNVFPYQIMSAYFNTLGQIPVELSNALQVALEYATENVVPFNKKVLVCVDVSGSMSSSITGGRGSVTSKVKCVDVAALFASTILRRNIDAKVLPFDTDVRQVTLNPMDSIVTNTNKLRINGGGTNCSVPLTYANVHKYDYDLVVFISDNESWVQSGYDRYCQGGSNMMNEWRTYQKRVKNAKMVLLDIYPNSSTQGVEENSIMNIGGFSDEVFSVINKFAAGENVNFVKEVESVEI